MTIQQELIDLCRRLMQLRGGTSVEATSELDLVRAQIRLIGRTAAFFGGFGGMSKLHDACEEATGNRNEIGGVLNGAWDGIDNWCA